MIPRASHGKKSAKKVSKCALMPWTGRVGLFNSTGEVARRLLKKSLYFRQEVPVLMADNCCTSGRQPSSCLQ